MHKLFRQKLAHADGVCAVGGAGELECSASLRSDDDGGLAEAAGAAPGRLQVRPNCSSLHAVPDTAPSLLYHIDL